MSKKRTSYKAYESTGTSKDSHIQLTNSMLMHPAFYTLKPRAQSLYVYCKNACWRKTGEEWKELKESEFYMNKAKYVHTYKLYTEGNANAFIEDMNALIENGLIDCVYQGQTQRKKNVYRLSTRWLEYGTDHYTIPPSVCSLSLKRKLYPQQTVK
mgnify:CR=1 FL=1